MGQSASTPVSIPGPRGEKGEGILAANIVNNELRITTTDQKILGPWIVSNDISEAYTKDDGKLYFKKSNGLELGPINVKGDKGEASTVPGPVGKDGASYTDLQAISAVKGNTLWCDSGICSLDSSLVTLGVNKNNGGLDISSKAPGTAPYINLGMNLVTPNNNIYIWSKDGEKNGEKVLQFHNEKGNGYRFLGKDTKPLMSVEEGGNAFFSGELTSNTINSHGGQPLTIKNRNGNGNILLNGNDTIVSGGNLVFGAPHNCASMKRSLKTPGQVIFGTADNAVYVAGMNPTRTTFCRYLLLGPA